MFNYYKKIKYKERILYNKILLLSRNKTFFGKFDIADTFQNRIYLIFLHISFLFIKLRKENKNQFFKDFSQKIFDHIFKEIEMNMRENGFGDMTVNKNMKFFIKNFYNILLNCEEYKSKSIIDKSTFLFNYLSINTQQNTPVNEELINYFDKYESFCFDLTPDSVLSGDLNFTYK